MMYEIRYVPQYSMYGVYRKDSDIAIARFNTEVQAESFMTTLWEKEYHQQIANLWGINEFDRRKYNVVELAVLMLDGNSYEQAKQLLSNNEVIIYNTNDELWYMFYAVYYNIDLCSIKLGKSKKFSYIKYKGYEYVIYYGGKL